MFCLCMKFLNHHYLDHSHKNVEEHPLPHHDIFIHVVKYGKPLEKANRGRQNQEQKEKNKVKTTEKDEEGKYINIIIDHFLFATLCQ